MTREEAIHFAECLKNNWTINFADMEEFCDLAIEALTCKNLLKPKNTCDVDIEEWVRCKDCKHWNGELHWCNIRDSYGRYDSCLYGERREE